MTFDVVITTYNRPHGVVQFVNQLLNCSLTLGSIIVVDSSDIPNTILHQMNRVEYIRSSHKNQPYQRYLGAQLSKADIICFFDDDLIVTNHSLFDALITPFLTDPNIVGVSVGIDYHNSISTKVASIQRGLKIRTLLKKMLNLQIEPGRISYFGSTGRKPQKAQFVEFFYGPCMTFKRALFMQTIDYQLLDIFEKKTGMGEDKIISMYMSTKGKLHYIPEIHLSHPAVESSYFNNTKDFIRKTTFSRHLLNKVYIHTHHKNKAIGLCKLFLYYTKQLFTAILNLIHSPTKLHMDICIGTTKGILLIINPPKTKFNWQKELYTDIKYYENRYE